MNRPSPTQVPRSERWRAEAGSQGLLRLEIPPHASRERVFDIHCAIRVRLREARSDAWHRMVVQVDGRLEWERRLATQSPGETDGLEVHLRRRVPIGEGLRLLVRSEVAVTQRLAIVIEAEEAEEQGGGPVGPSPEPTKP